MKTIYVVETSFRVNIAEAVVEEKEKSYKVISSTDLVGWTWIGKSLKKSDMRICPNLTSALLLAEEQAREIFIEKQEEYEAALKEYEVLREISTVLRDEPDKVMSAIEELRNK